MDWFPPSGEVDKEIPAEAAVAASATHHHDGELFGDEPVQAGRAIVVPFRRAIPGAADTAAPSLPPTVSAASVMLVAPPTGTTVPDYARRIVAEVVTLGAAHKNITLAPGDADAVERDVLAALGLADLYRLSMGDPAAMQKTGQSISDMLDVAALRHLTAFVLHVEDRNNAHDPAIVEIVAAIVKDIALAVTSGPIVWPDIAEAVARYYRQKPSVRVEALPDGTTITVHSRGSELHRDEQDGPALILRDTETGALLREGFYHEGEPHRDAGPAETRHYPDGSVSEHWYRHGLPHRDGKDGPAFVERRADGTVIEEFWYRSGDAHREPRHGPAQMWRCSETGHVYENYYRHGQLHRNAKDGPAVIVRDAAGSIIDQEYWVEGERIVTLEAVEASP